MRGEISLRREGGSAPGLKVYGGLLCTLRARALLAGDFQLENSQFKQPFSNTMDQNADRVAQALNRSTKDCMDMMGGADAAAVEELVSLFMVASPGSAQPPESKDSPLMNNVVALLYC